MMWHLLARPLIRMRPKRKNVPCLVIAESAPPKASVQFKCLLTTLSLRILLWSSPDLLYPFPFRRKSNSEIEINT